MKRSDFEAQEGEARAFPSKSKATVEFWPIGNEDERFLAVNELTTYVKALSSEKYEGKDLDGESLKNVARKAAGISLALYEYYRSKAGDESK